MRSLKTLFLILIILACCAPGWPASAQEGEAPAKMVPAKQPQPAQPNPGQRRIPVAVEHKGTDEVGARLVYNLKNFFNSSSLFRLAGKEDKKIKILIMTKEEFSGRPNMSSVYSIVWVFFDNPANLQYYLDDGVGFVHSASVKETAEGLAAKTEKVGSQYSYLYE